MPTARIAAARLDLVPFSADWLSERYVGWLNDPEVVRFSRHRGRTLTLDDCRAYMDSFAGTANHFWAIVAHDPAVGHVGNISTVVDPQAAVAQLNILIGEKRCWSQGYGAEAWTAALDWLLGEGGMRAVWAGTRAANAGMIRLMEKSAMIPGDAYAWKAVLELCQPDDVFAYKERSVP